MTVIHDDPLVIPLLPTSTSFVADPVYANTVEVEYGVVSPADPTGGPNRFTIHVPTDTTRLSLGAKSGAWDTDIGITGHTEAHIHFETKAGADKTVVSLGEPATTAAITGHGAEAEGEHAASALAPVGTQGYSMVTAQRAWHFSMGQHYALSQAGDISVRTMGAGKRAVIQAENGFVDVNGGKEVNLTGGSISIGAQSGIQFDEACYGKAWTAKTPTSVAAENVSYGMDCISILFAIHDLILGPVATYRKGVPKKQDLVDLVFTDVAKWVADLAMYKKAVDSLGAGISHDTAAPGCVKISAENDIGCVGGTDVGLFGLKGAVLGAALSASVSAGLMASLKGTLFAGVGSVLSSLKAVKAMEVVSDHGDVGIGAKKNVEITADEEFLAAGEELAQVTSEDAVLLGSSKRVWIGTGKGFGMLLDNEGIAFGKAEEADKMLTAKITDASAIRIDKGKIEIRGTDACVTLSDDLCLIEGPAIHFDAKKKNVTFNSQSALVFK